MIERTLTISIDEKRPLSDGFRQLRFISQSANLLGDEQNSRVFKDYVLSSEPYVLG